MKKTFLLFVLILCGSFTSFSQSSCPCCTVNHQSFDFWVGEWTVYDSLGAIQGTNTITKLEDGCIVRERWIGAKSTTGRSFNYYNQKDSTWNQVWIDNKGGQLILKGGIKDQTMVMQSDPVQGKDGMILHQVQWTPHSDGSVEQTWDVLDLEGNHLKTLFVGYYRKK